MEAKEVQAYFEADSVVAAYSQAAIEVGLWRSEEMILRRVFRLEDSLLELGCGAGRIALGLYELGFRHVLGSDYARSMVEQARYLAQRLEYPVPFQVADATSLDFEDGIFDGAIFGFNGLMQIPGASTRRRALGEIHRVLRPGAYFVLTTHDRERSPHQAFWAEEAARWATGRQSADLEILGDRAEEKESGWHFMHVPTEAEMRRLLKETGFRVEATLMRSEIADEPPEVEAFADDCRFWVVERIGDGGWLDPVA